MNNIAKKMKKQRNKLGLSAKAVTRSIGVAESTYRDWEHGRSIQGEPYIAIAKVLQIPVLELIGFNKIVEHNILQELDEIIDRIKTIKEIVITGDFHGSQILNCKQKNK